MNHSMLDLMVITHIYCDGGVVWKNPSPIGGSWAFALVDKYDECLYYESGFVQSTPNRNITNNVSEQIAIVKALEHMPQGWSGTVCSDSQVALGRAFLGWKRNGLPNNVSKRLDLAILSLGKLDFELLQGHPTCYELASSIGARTGKRVSRHNVLCDKLCNDISRLKMSEIHL